MINCNSSAFLGNLLFSLNSTIPIFIMMVFGWIIKKIGILDDHTTGKINQFAFKMLLPALLFKDLSTADFKEVWDGKFVGFCFVVTIICICIALLLSLLHKDKFERGEFVQASYRSSAAVLGIAFVNNIYGYSTMAALMIVGTVPLYNIMAVIILSLTSPEKNKNSSRKELVLKTFKDVISNPIIIGIAVGLIWSVLDIPQPVIMEKSISYLANMATPLSLIALGASFKIGDVKEKLPTVMLITFTKLVLFCVIFIPVAIKIGFRGEKLIAILVMLGSATTGSCFVMSRNMGHKGAITACSVMCTTLFSAFTLTLWLFILKSLEYV